MRIRNKNWFLALQNPTFQRPEQNGKVFLRIGDLLKQFPVGLPLATSDGFRTFQNERIQSCLHPVDLRTFQGLKNRSLPTGAMD
jgi:hypothetical protein